jgi:hypothetical protein
VTSRRIAYPAFRTLILALVLGALPQLASGTGNVVTVATAGGDFADPVQALASITTASATNRYLVKVLPGVYDVGEGAIHMQPYVDMEGSGEGVTVLRGCGSPQAVIWAAGNSEIRSLTVDAGCPGRNWASGIYAEYNDAQGVLKHVTVRASSDAFNGATNPIGLYRSPMRLESVTVSASGAGMDTWAIRLAQSDTVLENVQILAPGGSRTNTALWCGGSNVRLVNSSVEASGPNAIAFQVAPMPSDSPNGLLRIEHSAIVSSGIAIFAAQVPLYIGASRIEGSVQVWEYGGSVKCIGAYDGSFAPLNCSTP